MDLIPLYFEPEVYVNLPFAWGRGRLVRKVRFGGILSDFPQLRRGKREENRLFGKRFEAFWHFELDSDDGGLFVCGFFEIFDLRLLLTDVSIEVFGLFKDAEEHTALAEISDIHIGIHVDELIQSLQEDICCFDDA